MVALTMFVLELALLEPGLSLAVERRGERYSSCGARRRDQRVHDIAERGNVVSHRQLVWLSIQIEQLWYE